jgi:hypothetical protein
MPPSGHSDAAKETFKKAPKAKGKGHEQTALGL